MTARLVRAVLACTALLWAVGAAPRPLAASTEPDATGIKVRTLEGTTWASRAEGPDRVNVTYFFGKGGRLVYGYNGATYRNGTWRQDGDRLYFEMNNRYRECRAKFRGGRIEGESWNRAGRRWHTSLARSDHRVE